MRCDEVRERLLVPEEHPDAHLYAHLSSCPACAAAALSASKLDTLLRANMVVEPPMPLKSELARLALSAARPAAPGTIIGRVGAFVEALFPSSTVALVQALVVLLLAAAAVQVREWLASALSSAGTIPFGLQIAASSLNGVIRMDPGSLAGQLGSVAILLMAIGTGWVYLESLGRYRSASDA